MWLGNEAGPCKVVVSMPRAVSLARSGCPASHGQDGKTVGHERHEAEFLSYSMICLSIDKHSSVFIPC